jgi:5-formyltetrahydrofolate cyclo-ligase
MFNQQHELTGSKQNLRKKFSTQLNNLTSDQIEQYSQQVIFNLKKLPQFQQAESFFIYISHGNEVKTHNLITKLLANKKIVTVPKIINKNQMIPVKINHFNSFKRGGFGILEPIASQAYVKKVDICITPGLAFSRKLERLGRGGGFYDQYLNNNPSTLSIALAYDFQVVEELPTNSQDHKIKLIVAQSGVISK